MISLALLKPLLLTPSLSEAQFIRHIEEMSQKFTQNRQHIDDYTLSESHVSAYTLLYMPTNMPKLDFLLQQLPAAMRETLAQGDVIDFGCGPGTFSLAWLEFFSKLSGQLFLVDASELMLEQAKRLLTGLYPQAKASFYNHPLPAFPPRSKRTKPLTLLFGHSFNELGYEKGLKLIEQIDPDYILMIEPGTPSFFSVAIDLRKKLISDGWDIAYPCANCATCPMERRESDWCHGVLQVTHSQEIERLCQLNGLDRRHLPFISFAFSREKIQKESLAHYVQLLEENKFSFQLAVCMSEGQNLVYRRFEVLKRHLNNKEVKAFRQLSVGSTLRFSVDKVIKEDHWRVKLLE